MSESGGYVQGQVSDSVLLNTFVIHKKKCRVYFHRRILIWETERAPYTRCTLPLADVLAVHYIHSEDKSHCCPTVLQQQDAEAGKAGGDQARHNSFVIHYAERGDKNKWRHHSVTLNHTDPRQVASWVKTIRKCLHDTSRRPKKFLVFVNPYGGKKKGVRIYEKQVKPMFAMAGIEANVIVTRGRNHAMDTLLTCSLDNVDAVACVGGDGTFSEVFNGLVLRTAKDHGIDYNDPDARLPTPSLPLGIIPGGSTDTMAYCFHGTTDIQTAVLHLILGTTLGLDICSVHSNATLLRYYSSVISYGYLGDVVRDSEKFRWMGPRRYDYSGFKKFIANKGYEGEVTLLTDSSDPEKGPKCCENCQRCQNKLETKKSMNRQIQGESKTFRGKFFMVNGANVSCACVRSPNGISPYCHLGDGCVDVLLIKHTNLFNNLRLLLRLSSKAKNVFDLPFVEVHRATELTFRALPAPLSEQNCSQPRLIPGRSVWNCDGEVQWETNIRIRVHCQLLRILTRGRQEILEEPTCRFC